MWWVKQLTEKEKRAFKYQRLQQACHRNKRENTEAEGSQSRDNPLRPEETSEWYLKPRGKDLVGKWESGDSRKKRNNWGNCQRKWEGRGSGMKVDRYRGNEGSMRMIAPWWDSWSGEGNASCTFLSKTEGEFLWKAGGRGGLESYGRRQALRPMHLREDTWLNARGSPVELPDFP